MNPTDPTQPPTSPIPPPSVPPTPNSVTNPAGASPVVPPSVPVSPAGSTVVVAGGQGDQAGQPSPVDGSGPSDYLSNPFLNAVRGLVLTLSTNPGPALLSTFITLMLIGVAYLVAVVLLIASPALAIIAFIVVDLLGLWSVGTFYVIGGASARGEVVTLRQAYKVSLKKLLPSLGLGIISAVMVGIGLILLIIPGIILLGRISLAPIVLFEENLGPIAALKRSFSLTKGHVNEMLGALFAGTLIGETYYSLLFGAISVSPLVGRYHDLRQLQESGAEKPKTHWLNYLYLIGPIVIALMIIFIAIPAIHNEEKKTTPVYTPSNSFTTTSPSYNDTTFSQ